MNRISIIWHGKFPINGDTFLNYVYKYGKFLRFNVNDQICLVFTLKIDILL